MSFGVVTVLFAGIFKVLPDVHIHWRDTWVGAGITALLFSFGKFLIGLYLAHSAFASTYGAAGSLTVVLIWIYYSTQIFFIGAEFTQVYTRYMGRQIVIKRGRPTGQAKDQRRQGRAGGTLLRRQAKKGRRKTPHIPSRYRLSLGRVK